MRMPEKRNPMPLGLNMNPLALQAQLASTVLRLPGRMVNAMSASTTQTHAESSPTQTQTESYVPGRNANEAPLNAATPMSATPIIPEKNNLAQFVPSLTEALVPAVETPMANRTILSPTTATSDLKLSVPSLQTPVLGTSPIPSIMNKVPGFPTKSNTSVIQFATQTTADTSNPVSTPTASESSKQDKSYRHHPPSNSTSTKSIPREEIKSNPYLVGVGSAGGIIAIIFVFIIFWSKRAKSNKKSMYPNSYPTLSQNSPLFPSEGEYTTDINNLNHTSYNPTHTQYLQSEADNLTINEGANFLNDSGNDSFFESSCESSIPSSYNYSYKYATADFSEYSAEYTVYSEGR